VEHQAFLIPFPGGKQDCGVFDWKELNFVGGFN